MAKRTKRQVISYISECLETMGWVTYPQLLRYLASKNVEVAGDFNLEVTEKNVLLWGNLSQVVVDSITELMREQKLLLIPASPQVYQLDQLVIHEPVITELPAEKLDKPSVFLTVLHLNIPEPSVSQTSPTAK